MLLQIVQKNNHKIITTFGLVIKRIFVKDCCGSNGFIDNFKNAGLVILSYHIFLKNTVTEKNLIRLSKNTDKKGSDLSTDNFYCFSDNRYMKNTQKCIYVLERANLNLIL